MATENAPAQPAIQPALVLLLTWGTLLLWPYISYAVAIAYDPNIPSCLPLLEGCLSISMTGRTAASAPVFHLLSLSGATGCVLCVLLLRRWYQLQVTPHLPLRVQIGLVSLAAVGVGIFLSEATLESGRELSDIHSYAAALAFTGAVLGTALVTGALRRSQPPMAWLRHLRWLSNLMLALLLLALLLRLVTLGNDGSPLFTDLRRAAAWALLLCTALWWLRWYPVWRTTNWHQQQTAPRGQLFGLLSPQPLLLLTWTTIVLAPLIGYFTATWYEGTTACFPPIQGCVSVSGTAFHPVSVPIIRVLVAMCPLIFIGQLLLLERYRTALDSPHIRLWLILLGAAMALALALAISTLESTGILYREYEIHFIAALTTFVLLVANCLIMSTIIYRCHQQPRWLALLTLTIALIQVLLFIAALAWWRNDRELGRATEWLLLIAICGWWLAQAFGWQRTLDSAAVGKG